MTMIRMFGTLAAAMLTCMSGSVGAIGGAHEGIDDAGMSLEVAALLTAAHGAPPLICRLAACSIRGWGLGGGDAPLSPLSAVGTPVCGWALRFPVLPLGEL